MAAKVFRYELTEDAELDVDFIFEYSLEIFGYDQAIRYLAKLKVVFESLCINPETGRHRTDIVNGLRSLRYESHIIFYKVVDDCIIILRILHHSRDLSRLIW